MVYAIVPICVILVKLGKSIFQQALNVRFSGQNTLFNVVAIVSVNLTSLQFRQAFLYLENEFGEFRRHLFIVPRQLFAVQFQPIKSPAERIAQSPKRPRQQRRRRQTGVADRSGLVGETVGVNPPPQVVIERFELGGIERQLSGNAENIEIVKLDRKRRAAI